MGRRKTDPQLVWQYDRAFKELEWFYKLGADFPGLRDEPEYKTILSHLEARVDGYWVEMEGNDG